MTQNEFHIELLPVLHALWPRFFPRPSKNPDAFEIKALQEGSRIAFRVLGRYEIGSAVEAARTVGESNSLGRGYGKSDVLDQVRKQITGDNRALGSGGWTVEDEVNLGHLVAQTQRLVAEGKLGEEHLATSTICSERLGKNPSEMERREAQAILDKHMGEARKRLRDRGKTSEEAEKIIPSRTW